MKSISSILWFIREGAGTYAIIQNTVNALLHNDCHSSFFLIGEYSTCLICSLYCQKLTILNNQAWVPQNLEA